ncbi:hypothetical protein GCK32_018690 [Trichostrongylus colubriformis]|uniref:Uncharacterized protein n=1 Tax=Trichostrongylus colubriformis TaxID=6319 RepID=A0AAN8IW13_TRICO
MRSVPAPVASAHRVYLHRRILPKLRETDHHVALRSAPELVEQIGREIKEFSRSIEEDWSKIANRSSKCWRCRHPDVNSKIHQLEESYVNSKKVPRPGFGLSSFQMKPCQA